MKLVMELLVAVVIMGILGTLAINWMGVVPEPTDPTTAEYQAFTNLTDTTDMAYTASNGVMILVVVALVFAAMMFLAAKVL